MSADPKMVVMVRCPSNPGTVQGGYRCKATRNGVGDWTIQLDGDAFDAGTIAFMFPSVTLQGAATNDKPPMVDIGAAVSQVAVKTFDAAGNAVDRAFWFGLWRCNRL